MLFHPYREEYRKIMQDPIFQNPKVLDWGGGRDSQTPDLLTFLVRKNPVKALKVIAEGAVKLPVRALSKIVKRIKYGKI